MRAPEQGHCRADSQGRGVCQEALSLGARKKLNRRGAEGAEEAEGWETAPVGRAFFRLRSLGKVGPCPPAVGRCRAGSPNPAGGRQARRGVHALLGGSLPPATCSRALVGRHWRRYSAGSGVWQEALGEGAACGLAPGEDKTQAMLVGSCEDCPSHVGSIPTACTTAPARGCLSSRFAPEAHFAVAHVVAPMATFWHFASCAHRTTRPLKCPAMSGNGDFGGLFLCFHETRVNPSETEKAR